MIRADKTSSGPVALATRFGAEIRATGRPVRMTVEFTTFDRRHRLASSTHVSKTDIDGTLTLEPVPKARPDEAGVEREPTGNAQAYAPFVRDIGRRQGHAIWTSLKRLKEDQARTR